MFTALEMVVRVDSRKCYPTHTSALPVHTTQQPRPLTSSRISHAVVTPTELTAAHASFESESLSPPFPALFFNSRCRSKTGPGARREKKSETRREETPRRGKLMSPMCVVRGSAHLFYREEEPNGEKRSILLDTTFQVMRMDEDGESVVTTISPEAASKSSS